VELSAYRITQEALTNVIRHAGAASVAVTVRYLPQAVELSVVDDGRGAGAGAGAGVEAGTGAGAAAATSGGHGILGMRERAALFNGELSAGARAGGGGFEVRALLPFDGARS
jgi:signal transduction histidine kinase